jgi:phosphoribosylamine--glycine ligase
MMGEKVFGEAGEKVVVEEYLSGIEASVLCFVDEKTIVPMESAQDYKRIFDNDEGPNTGGMGTYSPSRVFDEKLKKRIMDEILTPTLKGLQTDGLDFQGVLFVGLMITDESPKVIEFNIRFGDPEAQSVLPRLETDLIEILKATTENRLDEIDIKWCSKKAVCVVLASEGYPGSCKKGFAISGLEKVGKDILVFHSGTANEHVCDETSCKSVTVTSGGRVLGVTALADTHDEARKKVYDNIGKISFHGMQYRRDIAKFTPEPS